MTAALPTLVELTTAVLAEGRPVDLDGAVRRVGDENAVLETHEWIYRFPKDFIDFDREMRVLAALHGRLPVATPRVEWVGEKSRFCAYRKITGWQLDRRVYQAATRSRRRALGRSLAEYLAAIHHLLTEAEIASIGIPDFFSLAQRADLIRLDSIPAKVRDEVAQLVARAHHIDDRVSGRILLHDDFTSDNMVFDGEMGPLSGVWDFSHSSVGPACFDFRYLDNEPAPLTSDVVQEYERITGLEIDQEAFAVATRVADVIRQIKHGTPETLVSIVSGWSDDGPR
jgi:aminoglycoside phosphotransferase (APT) family kinase protein